MATSEEELLNSSSRLLYFKECLWIFQIFYSGKYIPVWYYIMSNASLHMTQLAGKETIFNNLSKLIELKLISTTWPQRLTPKNKVTHQQISTCRPKSFLVTLKFSSLFIVKSFFNVNFYTWRRALISHVVCLGKTSNSWYKYSGPFLMPNILQYAQNSQCVQNSVFPSGKHVFPNPLINF